MEYLENLYELCEFLNKDIKRMNDKIRKQGGELTSETLTYVDKLTHALKSVKTSIAMIEEEESGYSSRGSYARGDRTGRVHWNDGSVSYGDGMGGMGDSYARGRGRTAKRDSMGRYSSERGYSRDDAHDDVIEQLRDLMQDANASDKQKYQRFINELEQM